VIAERILSITGEDSRKRVRSATLLGAGGLVPDVVGDGRGRHGEARFAGGGRSYD
jgi:hypothetical protein